MTDQSIYISSLRLSRLFGGGCGGSDSPTSSIQWFYNGSTRFEDDVTNPKLFGTLTEAVRYFTANTTVEDRTVGQFVTFAETSRRNWVVYIYMGPDVEDENYSNPIFWHPFGSTFIDPYTNIQEVLLTDKAYQESLFANNIVEEVLKVERNHG